MRIGIGITPNIVLTFHTSTLLRIASAVCARSFVTGGYDGTLRLQHFDASYYKEETIIDDDMEKLIASMTKEDLQDLLAGGSWHCVNGICCCVCIYSWPQID